MLLCKSAVFFALVLLTPDLTVAQVRNSANTLAAGEEFQPPDASIGDLAWIAGDWHGEAMGGTFEESWNEPMGGAIMGMFKFVQGDQPEFYEILTIVPDGKSLTLRLKHFHRDLRGWEEKDETVDFRLVRLAKNEANFDGLTFRRIGPNRMNTYVVVNRGEGQPEEVCFECHRRPARASENDRGAGSRPSAERESMLRVIEIDRVLACQRDQMTNRVSLASTIETYVDGLAAIDFEGTPADFAEACEAHRLAWQNSVGFLQQYGELRGEMHELLDQIGKMDDPLAAGLDGHLAAIMETWTNVEIAMSRYP